MIPQDIKIKIVFGYKATDFVVVNSMEEVARAYHAKLEKLPISIGGKVISGQEIKLIEPDVHGYTGWNRSYIASDADDFAQIERDVPKVMDELISLTTKRVEAVLSSSQPLQVGDGSFQPTKLLGNTNQHD